MTSVPRPAITDQTRLAVLSESEIQPVFRATHKIWSAGLELDSYIRYNQKQRSSVWGRKNLSMVGIRDDRGRVKSSCKLYHLTLTARGIEHGFYGIGALYTAAHSRNQGLASDLIEQLVDRACDDGISGLILFSDIGSDFYGNHGFCEAGGASFTINLPKGLTLQNPDMVPAYQTLPLRSMPIDYLERHYQRWLARQAFGVVRDSFYWQYKINKEAYLTANSRLGWPDLTCLVIKDLGYAILENGGATLRVLEIAAKDEEPFWHAIVAHAINCKARRLRGWESVLKNFAPGFALDRYLKQTIIKSDSDIALEFSERSWGRPMLLPIDDTVDDWLALAPCPILELDHL